MHDLTTSNSLTDLAARIRAEHEAVDIALKDSLRHALTAGELLIETKQQLKHGQWLPWLRDYCTISERTAQLYMRVAKNRTEIEAEIRNDVADLTLNEAVALLALSSNVRELLAFARRVEDADPEEIVSLCAEKGIACITRNPFGAKEPSELSEPELVEWHLWMLFGVKVNRVPLEEASYYTDRLQSRGWSLAGWYGEEGDKYRKLYNMRAMPQQAKDDWHAFLAENADRALSEIRAEIEDIERRRCERVATTAQKRIRRRRAS